MFDIYHSNRRTAITRFTDDCACVVEYSDVLLVFVDSQPIISLTGVDGDGVDASGHIVAYCISALPAIHFYSIVALAAGSIHIILCSPAVHAYLVLAISSIDSHIIFALAANLSDGFVSCTIPVDELGVVDISTKLVDCIIPVAGQGGLVAGVRPPAVLINRVVAGSPFGILSDITPETVLTNMIIPRSAEQDLSIPTGQRHGRIADGGLQYQGKVKRRGSMGWVDTGDDDRAKE